MKNLLSLSLVLTTTAMAFAQGKLSFDINSDNLIYFTTDVNLLAPGDATRTADNGFGAGPLPIAGSTLYTGLGLNNTPGTIASLPGSPTFTVALYGGTSSSSLSLQTTTTIADVSNPGGIVAVNHICANLPVGTPAWFQVQVYDSRDANVNASMSAGHYHGMSQIFQVTPQASYYAPIYATWPPVSSTWAPGTFVPTDLAAIGMSGMYGGISVQAVRCLGPYWMGFRTEPTNQVVVVGSNAVFYVGAQACPPPYYQWYFNGVGIPGANDCILAGGYGSFSYSAFQITNAQLTNAGTYYAVLSNSAWPSCCGTVHVSGATLTVVPKPTVTSPPQSQTAETGSTIGFYVNATNIMPLSYQWFFNGAVATTGNTTNYSLLLTNVQPYQAGAYTVVVTNIAGAVTSAPAMLSVIPTVARRPVPGVKVTGQAGSLLNVDYANALSPTPGWTTDGSVSLSSTSQYYFDLTLPLPAQRFYRAWQTGTAGVIPSLDLHLVPAITLTGNIGASLRLDYINQFGPTDSWVTLDTVTLTNTSQLYFDTSAPGQPQRLYRLVPLP